MTDEKVVETTSLPTIGRGTGSRTKMSRKRFLALMMAGLMIVAAVSMTAPSILGNTRMVTMTSLRRFLGLRLARERRSTKSTTYSRAL